MLRGLDALVIDLQDIGARIYTYIYTMANCLRAGARHGVPVIVCDRPNPINGVDVEGAALVPGFESFVGQFPIPMRHGMTIGELARLFNAHFGLGAQLEVVEMEGWRREMFADETGAAVGDAVAQHADARHRGRLSGHGAVRGDAALGRTRHDAAVRARRRAGHRGRALRPRDERAGPAGRRLPAGGVRADVPEAREAGLRRLPDARDRSARVQAGAHRRGAHRDVPSRRRPRSRCGASRRTSTSTTSCRSTSSPGRRSSASRSRRARAPRAIGRQRGARDEDAFRALRAPYLLY